MGIPKDSLLASVPSTHERPVAEGVRAIDRYIEGPWVLGGRYATGLWVYLDSGVRPHVRDPFNDLDIATKSLAALPKPTANNEVVYAHAHPEKGDRPHYAKMLVGVGIGVDVFGTHPKEPEPVMVPLGKWGVEVPVRSADAHMAIMTWWLVRRVTEHFGYGPHSKIVAAVDALASLARKGVVSESEVEKIWRNCFPEAPVGAFVAYEWAKAQALGQPEAQTSRFRRRAQLLLGQCARCDRFDPKHPLISDRQAAQRTRRARARAFVPSAVAS